MERRDAQLSKTLALPNGAANVTGAIIDTGKKTSMGQQVAEFEFLLTMPALTTAQLGDGATMKYDILASDNADLSNPIVLISSGSYNLTQTGAGGAGAAAQTRRFRLATDAKEYIGVKATNSAGGNASTANATLELLTL